MRPLIIFIIMAVFISCKDDAGIGGSPYTPPAETLLRVAVFSAQNGSTISGQIEVWKENANGTETLELLNDFKVSGISGTIQFWLTDNTGSNNLVASTKKTIVDSLTTNYSGEHIFNIPAGITAADYTYVVAFHRNSMSHIGKAQLLLPQPPGKIIGSDSYESH